jgi:hypothetical protein
MPAWCLERNNSILSVPICIRHCFDAVFGDSNPGCPCRAEDPSLETLNVGDVVKGTPVRSGCVQIVPLFKRLRLTTASDSGILALCTMEAVGVQVQTPTRRYALDLEGRESEELADL